MTCYDCDGCRRGYIHISQLGDFDIKFKIGNKTITKTIWLCKWCMTKAGVKYNIVNDYVEVIK